MISICCVGFASLDVVFDELKDSHAIRLLKIKYNSVHICKKILCTFILCMA